MQIYATQNGIFSPRSALIIYLISNKRHYHSREQIFMRNAEKGLQFSHNEPSLIGWHEIGTQLLFAALVKQPQLPWFFENYSKCKFLLILSVRKLPDERDEEKKNADAKKWWRSNPFAGYDDGKKLWSKSSANYNSGHVIILVYGAWNAFAQPTYTPTTGAPLCFLHGILFLFIQSVDVCAACVCYGATLSI